MLGLYLDKEYVLVMACSADNGVYWCHRNRDILERLFEKRCLSEWEWTTRFDIDTENI